MKRLFTFVVLGLSLGLASCQKEDVSNSSDQPSLTTLQVKIPQQMQSRAIADYGQGSEINRCILEIYRDGKLYGQRAVVAVENGSATFTDLQLVASQTYDIVLWADCANSDLSDLYYTTTDLSAISAAKSYTGNDDGFDAFYATQELTVTEAFNGTITLTRPFGQLTVKTLDLNSIQKEELKPTQVTMTLASVPTQFNALTGEASEEQTVTYTTAFEDATTGELTVDYIWAPESESNLVNFEMEFLNGSNTTIATNYRTNVSGNLVTKKGVLNVTIDPDFATPDYEVEVIENTAELTALLQNGGSAKLATDLELDASFEVNNETESELDLNGKTLTITKSIYLNAADGGVLTFKNGTIVANDMQSSSTSLFNTDANGSITLDGVTLKTNGTGIGPNNSKNNGVITVRNSTLECGAYAVATNASMPVAENVYIYLENSTFTGSTPLCINIPCYVAIDGCTITGDTQAAMLRGGTATIRNSTFTFTTDPFESEEDARFYAEYFITNNWGGGNMVNCAALVLGNKAPGTAYQYPTVVTLEKTTVETIGKYASLFPAMYAHANQGEGLGVTINYDDECVFTGDCTYGSKNITVNGVAQNE